jgi:hypothetical protein
MGSPIAQVAPSTQPQGKGSTSSVQQPIQPNPADMSSPAMQPQGKGGSVTYPGQGGQPKLGQPNMYPNTIGQWDNASIQPQQSRNSGGKGKG